MAQGQAMPSCAYRLALRLFLRAAGAFCIFCRYGDQHHWVSRKKVKK